jgi:hypothetical protein
LEEELIGLAAHGLLVPRPRDVAQTLNTSRLVNRNDLAELVARAQTAGVLGAGGPHMMEQFFGLLWGEFMLSRLLGAVKVPKPEAIGQRARMVAEALLTLYAKPISDQREQSDGGREKPLSRMGRKPKATGTAPGCGPIPRASGVAIGSGRQELIRSVTGWARRQTTQGTHSKP